MKGTESVGIIGSNRVAESTLQCIQRTTVLLEHWHRDTANRLELLNVLTSTGPAGNERQGDCQCRTCGFEDRAAPNAPWNVFKKVPYIDRSKRGSLTAKAMASWQALGSCAGEIVMAGVCVCVDMDRAIATSLVCKRQLCSVDEVVPLLPVTSTKDVQTCTATTRCFFLITLEPLVDMPS